MATRCVCRRRLEDEPETFELTVAPCRCDRPCGGPRQAENRDIPSHVFKQQFEERERLGLPMETDTEKGIRKRWQ